MRPFTRKYFIRDLFSPRGLLNSFFETIEFDSVSDFSLALSRNWLELGSRKQIIIRLSDPSIPLVEALISQSSLLSGDFFTFDITNLSDCSLVKPLLAQSNFQLRVALDRISKPEDLNSWIPPGDWRKNNPIWIHTILTKENYKNDINSLIEIYTKTPFRFAELRLDYLSLSQLSFQEYEDLRFRLNDLTTVWGSKSGIGEPLITEIKGDFKKVYMSESKLYEDFLHQSLLLDLEHVNDFDGETFPTEALSRFRAYIDLPGFASSLKNLSQISPHYNKILTGAYTILPTIEKVILENLEEAYDGK